MPKSFEEPITDRTKVKSPKSGRLIMIATAVRQGFMKEIVREGRKGWEWADHVFPQETPLEAFERSESLRVFRFIKENSDLPHPSDLGATIKTDNGRLRLWFEITEHTSLKEDKKRLAQLKQWKYRLVRSDEKRDPLPHPIPCILARIEQAGVVSDRKKHELVAKEVNLWIGERLSEWQKANGRARRTISSELLGVLKPCVEADCDIAALLDKAQDRIKAGTHPFPEHRSRDGRIVRRDEWPVTPKNLKSRVRTWRKKLRQL